MSYGTALGANVRKSGRTHNNAPAHTSLIVRQFLASKNRTVIPHPTYSPDLASCDFFLFPKIKFRLKGCRFDTIEEIQAESKEVLKALTLEDFQGCMESLYPCSRGLLRRRQWKLGVMISKFFMGKFPELLGRPMYIMKTICL
jgi:hypothetical protein